ncbi:MAG: hypothetical protein ACLGHN_12575 [Bacteriovoracia bacterium]
MKYFAFLLTLSLSLNIFAQDYFQVETRKMDFKAQDALRKVETVLSDPEDLLEKYTPAGAEISQKTVTNDTIKFHAKKRVGLITKSVWVLGKFDVYPAAGICNKGEAGYMITMNFHGSDDLVYENIEKFDGALCLLEKNYSFVASYINVKIFKGSSYSGIFGSIVRDIIEAQIDPLLKALSDEVQKKD